PGDAPDDERDHGVLDQVRAERRPFVEHVRIRFPPGRSPRVADAGEREDEPGPEDERKPHASLATASGSGAARNRTPAARAACSSALRSPICKARSGLTARSSSASRMPSGAGFRAAGTTTAKNDEIP